MKISVILPVYNKVKYVENILWDLEAQTFQKFECLIVDDGSNDGSGVLCDKVAQEDSRFRVFHIPNGGVSHARNYALARAKGEFVTFVDADDRIAPQFLQNLFDNITNYNTDLVISNMMKLWEDGKEESMQEYPYEGVYSIERLLPEFVKCQKEYGFYGFCVAKIFKREVLGNIRFDEKIKLAEDYDFYLKIYSKIQNIYFDNHRYYYYLQASDNSSQCVSDYAIDYLTQFKIHLHTKKFLEMKNTYSGSNKALLDTLLEDYIYYSLFYAEIYQLSDVFSELQKLTAKEHIVTLNDKKGQKGFVLKMFWTNHLLVIKVYLWCYRMLRKVVKGH